jgi:hypothetical protein
VKRAQPTEIDPLKIGKESGVHDLWKGKLQASDEADEHARDPPEHGGDDAELDDVAYVAGLFFLGDSIGISTKQEDRGARHARHERPRLDYHRPFWRLCGFDDPRK